MFRLPATNASRQPLSDTLRGTAVPGGVDVTCGLGTNAQKTSDLASVLEL